MNVEELLIIAVVAVILIGPQHLPKYAEQLARLVRTLRDMARGATESIREELGPDADLDFSKLDPRQYDPRRIVRDALLDEVNPNGSRTKPSGTGTRNRSASNAGRAASGAAAATSTATRTKDETDDATDPIDDGQATTASDAAAENDAGTDAVVENPLANGAPFDDEAT
ncbi:twin-arginine translocase TatA/TatE family subunit [Ruania alkalisoli]|uniref:Twin-arginine translocase TatA/TatE family subunit n=1 Tax=Ruania alkalisoli TaxID=2779775 RepID=A0A7M1SYI4_9MICO|nr:twin-arginine translocase TatA/TatE family subunit [Ruania alkalisoli]QOR72609.1 twin-arginine translocase TatA/TatE family subunit [Ruania alkalisoli]